MEKGSSNRRYPVEDFRAVFEAFGKAMSEVFNDPELKEKAKEFGNSIAKSAETLGQRLQDEDVKNKFREAGKAAQEFGKSIADYFKANKNSSDSSGKRR